MARGWGRGKKGKGLGRKGALEGELECRRPKVDPGFPMFMEKTPVNMTVRVLKGNASTLMLGVCRELRK